MYAASNIEQVLEAAPHKAAAVQPPVMKTIKVRRTRHAGHCWRSKDELISDVFLQTPSRGRAKAERLARTYIQQLYADTACSPEDLPEAMDDREGWQERVRDIRTVGATRWWEWALVNFLNCEMIFLKHRIYQKISNFLKHSMHLWSMFQKHRYHFVI